MPKYSTKQRKLRGRGKIGGPHFIQLFHYVKRSTSYHGLSPIARAFLTEIIDRYNGCNNGMIVLGVREAAYEIGCSQMSISRAARELDDAALARPTQLGAWRGRHATEWRLMWRRCDKTGDLPRNVWQERKPYVQLLLPAPRKVPLSDAERAKQYRRRKADRHDDRHDEYRQESAEVTLQAHRRDVSNTTKAQNGNSSIDASRPSNATGAHVHIYQGQGDDPEGEE
jgi:hypothetical protein